MSCTTSWKWIFYTSSIYLISILFSLKNNIQDITRHKSTCSHIHIPLNISWMCSRNCRHNSICRMCWIIRTKSNHSSKSIIWQISRIQILKISLYSILNNKSRQWFTCIFNFKLKESSRSITKLHRIIIPSSGSLSTTYIFFNEKFYIHNSRSCIIFIFSIWMIRSHIFHNTNIFLISIYLYFKLNLIYITRQKLTIRHIYLPFKLCLISRQILNININSIRIYTSISCRSDKLSSKSIIC